MEIIKKAEKYQGIFFFRKTSIVFKFLVSYSNIWSLELYDPLQMNFHINTEVLSWVIPF